MASPEGAKEMPYARPGTGTDGSANFVPKPDPDHEYASTKGALLQDKAIASPEGEKSTLEPLLDVSVEGFANLVPNPEADQG